MTELPELYFATSGIRGKANTVISPELGLRVGRAVSAWIKDNYSSKLEVYVGYDNRRNSHTIASTVVAGLSSSGVDAKLFSKPVPTPLVIYTTVNSDAKAGIMITGSHLPRDENGIILFDSTGLYYKGVLPESNTEPVEWDELGRIENITYEIDEYQTYLSKIVTDLELRPQDWDVLVDPVHGPMKEHLSVILKPLFSNVVKFNWKEDDTFSGRLSEPTPRNLEKTSKAVTVSKCDLGIATDMDGDRVIFITSAGRVISGDDIGALLATRYWEQYPDQPVIVPINTSAIIDYFADEYGGKYEYCKVGPPSIIKSMRDHDAMFGFEETGKYFFADYTISPDAAVSILILLSYLQNRGQTLEESLADLPSLHSSKTKIPANRYNGSKIMKLVENQIETEFDNIKNINTLDGLRINFENKSWLLIRPSGTEDYIRIFSEHQNPEMDTQLNQAGRKLVQSAIDQLQ